VVMILFFIISLVAAYAGRNIVFEQRTSANQYRSTVAFEAADAGLEWALSMLNGPRITDACTPTTQPANALTLAETSFRDRYFEFLRTPASVATEPGIHPVTGMVNVRPQVRDGPVWPTCVFDSATNAWTCGCPRAAASALAAPAGTGYAPAFRVRFVNVNINNVLGPPTRPGIIRIEVNGCTSLDNACLDFRPAHETECRGTVCAQVALASALKTAPEAALTARGNIDVGGAALSAYNTVPGASGVTILSGGVVNQTNLVLRGPSGTPSQRTLVENDPGYSAAAFTTDRMFASVFGVWRGTYWNQPGAVTLACVGTCTAADVRTALDFNPGRAILVPGNLDFDGGGDVGAAGNPALVVVTGNVTFSAPTNVFGFVYSEAANWATAGTGQVRGGMAGEGRISGNGSFAAVYDPEILAHLRWRTGSFAKVPGSWKDYP
jgi:Tfp pilus assembly protein PilX